MMKLVQLTAPLREKFGDRGAIRMIRDAGYDGYDFSMFHLVQATDGIGGENPLGYAKELRAYADSLGIPCLQGHAPFKNPKNAEDAAALLPYQLRAVEIAGILGCPVLVVHPGNDFTAEESYEHIYRHLLPRAKECGVKIATENMWNYDSKNAVAYPSACGSAEDFCRMVDLVGDPSAFGACLDIGHAEMPYAPGAPALIRALGKERLFALHVHDNDKMGDLHTIPFETGCKIRWQPIIDALREVGYAGNFTFETDAAYRRYPDELFPAVLRFQEEIGRYFIRELTK